MSIVAASVGRLSLAHMTVQAHGGHADGSSGTTPELIALTVGFVAFMGYVWREHRDEQRRTASLPTVEVDGPQWLTVTLLVVSGLGHVPVISEHLREAPYRGVLFIHSAYRVSPTR